MKRYASSQQIKEAIEHVNAGKCEPKRMLYLLLIQNLSPQQSRVYDFVGVQENPVTSSSLCDRFGWQANHASTMLKELWELGLFDRHEVRDSQGKRFEYRVGWDERL